MRKIGAFYWVLIAFVVMLAAWLGFVYVTACDFSLNCLRGQPAPQRTPIPTLIPATLPAPARAGEASAFNKCQVTAVDLLGAWVSADYPQTEAFPFSDLKGTACEATFAEDVLPLFVESSLWYPGSLSCASCHNADLSAAAAQLDLSSYAGILAGSRRAAPDASGADILGGGDWAASLLYDSLYVRKFMPLGRPADVPAEGPTIFAGRPLPGAPTVTPEPAPTAAPTPTPTP